MSIKPADNIEYYYSLYLQMLHMDADDDGKWITVNGTHIHLNEEGEADKGPTEVKEVINDPKKPSGRKTGKTPGSTQPQVLAQPQKSKVNASIKELADKVGDAFTYDDSVEVGKILDTLEPGSIVTIPERDGDISYRYKMDEYGYWVLVGGLGVGGIRSEDLAGEFFFENEEARAYVSKSAMSSEDIQKANESLKTWRNQPSAWTDKEKPLSSKSSVVMYADDINAAGEGTQIVGRNGTVYESLGDGTWINMETHAIAEKSELRGASFTGDFYETAFGLNGMSANNVHYLKETVDGMPDKMREAYEAAFRSHPVKLLPKNSESGAYYNPATGEVRISTGSAEPETVVHEFAHASDRDLLNKRIEESWGWYNISSCSANIGDVLTGAESNDDFDGFCKLVGLESDGGGWFSSDTPNDEIRRKTWDWCKSNKYRADGTVVEGFSCVSDAISGMTQDDTLMSIVYGGHEKKYWMTPYGGSDGSPQNKEYWANFCELKAFGYNDALNLLKQISPNRYAAAEHTFKEVFGNGE